MKHKIELKPAFAERMESLLGKKGFEEYVLFLEKPLMKSIRANTLKISVNELKKRLEKKSWVLKQPFRKFPEVMIVEGKIAGKNKEDNDDNYKGNVVKNFHKLVNANKDGGERSELLGGNNRAKQGKIIDLEPGELGRSLEHLLGYYYVQDISSMLPVMALNPAKNESVVDLCASPGSKTTQISAMMNNLGVLIANDVKLERIKILASNLERCGASNVIMTKNYGDVLCKRMRRIGFQADKILIDAPCSGEGTIRTSTMTAKMWNANRIYSLSVIQKNLLAGAVEILKKNGEIIYSTCTHTPEENEEVVDCILNNFKNIKVEKPLLPKELKANPGVLEWQGKSYLKEVKKCVRIYPQDNNTEGFFIAKLRKIG